MIYLHRHDRRLTRTWTRDAFDPNQPREPSGQWTEGSGGKKAKFSGTAYAKLDQRNVCGIEAAAAITGKPPDHVWESAKEHFKKGGMRPSAMHQALNKLGYTFNNMDFKLLFKKDGHNYNERSISELEAIAPQEGTYLVGTRNHWFVLKNGKTIDPGNTGKRTKVTEIYKIEPHRTHDEADAFPVPLDADLLYLAQNAKQQNFVQQIYQLQAERNRRRMRLGPDWDDADWQEEEHKRDEGGKFSETGGGAEAEKKSADLHEPQARQDWVNGIAERYGLPPQKLKFDSSLTEAGILAHASGDGISLNPDYFGKPEKYAEHEKRWSGGMVADASPRGTLLHELGHKMFQQIRPPAGMSSRFYNKWFREKDAIVQKYFDDPEMVISAFAQEHPHEWAAEAFAAQHNGKLEWPYTQKAADGAKAMWQELFAYGERDQNGHLKPGVKPRSVG
jgi:hypothetical protein